MGYMRHHAILVSTEIGDIYEAYAVAEHLGCKLSPVTESTINGVLSFAVFPDGSKEGWEESNTGDLQRKQLKQWLQAQKYEDGSSPFDWAEVQYGDDDGDNRIIETGVDTTDSLGDAQEGTQ